MTIRESTIESRVCDYAKRQGWLVRKFVSPSNRGVPDRIMFRNGHVLLIEFKAPGKKPTELQLREHSKLQQHGFNVFVIDDIDEGKALIDEMTHE